MSQLMIITPRGSGDHPYHRGGSSDRKSKRAVTRGHAQTQVAAEARDLYPYPIPARPPLSNPAHRHVPGYRRWWTWYKADARYYAWGQIFDQLPSEIFSLMVSPPLLHPTPIVISTPTLLFTLPLAENFLSA